MFTYVCSCLPMFTMLTTVYSIYVYYCLLLLVFMCTHDYSCLPIFNAVYSCLNYVYSYLTMFTTGDSSIPMYSIVYSCLFSYVYTSLLVFICVCSCLAMFTRLLIFTNVYHCLLVSTYVYTDYYLCLPMFSTLLVHVYIC